MARQAFHWDDPLLLDTQLTPEEIMVRDAAREYAAERLAPRVLQSFRDERAATGLKLRERRRLLDEADDAALAVPSGAVPSGAGHTSPN